MSKKFRSQPPTSGSRQALESASQGKPHHWGSVVLCHPLELPHKALLNRSLDVDRTTSLYEEAHGQEMVTMTEDMREGIAAFVERRDPAFKGW